MKTGILAANSSDVYPGVYLLGWIKLSIAGEDAICSFEEEQLSGGISCAGNSFKSNGNRILLSALFHVGGVAAVKKAKVGRYKIE